MRVGHTATHSHEAMAPLCSVHAIFLPGGLFLTMGFLAPEQPLSQQPKVLFPIPRSMNRLAPMQLGPNPVQMKRPPSPNIDFSDLFYEEDNSMMRFKTARSFSVSRGPRKLGILCTPRSNGSRPPSRRLQRTKSQGQDPFSEQSIVCTGS